MSESVKKGIKIFLFITVVTLILLLVFTVQNETAESLKKMKPVYFGLAFIVLAIYFYFDALKIQIIAKALDHKISIKTGIDIIISGIFLAAVTPFQTGGLPLQLYVLKKENVPYGTGTLIMFMKGITVSFFYMIALPIIFYFYIDIFSNSIVKNLVKYLVFIYSFAILFVIFAITLPDKISNLILKINKLLKKMKIVKSNKIEKFVDKFQKEIKYFLKGLKLFFTKKKLYLFFAILITFISFIFFFSIALIILLGLGVEIKNPLEVINLQFLHAFLVLFMPTPGASGISETLFAVLFSSVCKKSLLGIYAIIWRFFTFYLGAGIGGFLTLNIINKSGKSIEEIKIEEENYNGKIEE